MLARTSAATSGTRSTMPSTTGVERMNAAMSSISPASLIGLRGFQPRGVSPARCTASISAASATSGPACTCAVSVANSPTHPAPQVRDAALSPRGQRNSRKSSRQWQAQSGAALAWSGPCHGIWAATGHKVNALDPGTAGPLILGQTGEPIWPDRAEIRCARHGLPVLRPLDHRGSASGGCQGGGQRRSGKQARDGKRHGQRGAFAAAIEDAGFSAQPA